MIGERLGQVLKDIYLRDEILGQLQKFLLDDRSRQEALNKEQQERCGRQLAQVIRRMDLAYQDKLDGKINEEFWVRRSAEWQQEEHQIRSSLKAIEVVQPERYLNAARILGSRTTPILCMLGKITLKSQIPQNGTFELRD